MHGETVKFKKDFFYPFIITNYSFLSHSYFSDCTFHLLSIQKPGQC